MVVVAAAAELCPLYQLGNGTHGSFQMEDLYLKWSDMDKNANVVVIKHQPLLEQHQLLVVEN